MCRILAQDHVTVGLSDVKTWLSHYSSCFLSILLDYTYSADFQNGMKTLMEEEEMVDSGILIAYQNISQRNTIFPRNLRDYFHCENLERGRHNYPQYRLTYLSCCTWALENKGYECKLSKVETPMKMQSFYQSKWTQPLVPHMALLIWKIHPPTHVNDWIFKNWLLPCRDRSTLSGSTGIESVSMTPKYTHACIFLALISGEHLNQGSQR